MTPHDLIIFDCDGVLVDSEPASNQCLVDNLARYGLELDLARSMELFVGGTMAGVRDIARDMGANLPEEWLDEIRAETHARLAQGVEAVPGINALLDLADRADLPFCVASNGSPKKMRITLGQTGLWDRFEGAIFSAYELGVSKPDPALFQAAARHFDAQAPVVIEDSRSGVLAARRAGMRCLGYAPHGNGVALAELGAEVFADMRAVPRLLGLSGLTEAAEPA
ncbi:haloacid dehalogenase superfamily, subfamily IA, variant 3 with third motif having DD or ED/haloacid dehalogenase superfamily, subfamily IA, variant 1 with third motif having Dx(3-4)D or Dx(3-4)E [Cribrihabitans marinus]|uniref:phosphoglycolate phosphatase n=1 Tax=Cribrihabitans marinus TaxID=1227549 RepID=A0A1H7BTH9_9RHOB|nr:HAD family phosphatase [Cribrihabitans marinus]GGH33638.1 hydrolase [Cribrihabitans marinus]SEJ80983.1 haloacid dehalogenase superfamily, subfamily IA, variant 3 with third motif having DD or ED/haloacid dehalogenase superfamily, subfamily IA, variant 1 with third motif having Dx(3-4)D or Dx(3-4)E [Cribrihabitans marinus]